MRSNIVHDSAEWFTATRAAALSGHSLAMVNYLCREEIIEPSCSCPRGHGAKRHYSFGDLVALRLTKRLSEAGVSVLRLRKALQRLRKFHPEITLTKLPGSHVVTDGKDLYLRRKGEAIERVFDGQFAFAFVIELSHLQADISRAMKRKAA